MVVRGIDYKGHCYSSIWDCFSHKWQIYYTVIIIEGLFHLFKVNFLGFYFFSHSCCSYVFYHCTV